MRLPLSLGLAVSITRVGRPGCRRWGSRPGSPPSLPSPAVGSARRACDHRRRSARPEGYPAIPGHWRDAAAWLDARAEPGSVLVVPAAGFGDFVWGSTKDDPLQANRPPARSPSGTPCHWARPGATRWLDVVERSLQSGTGGDRLRQGLWRALASGTSWSAMTCVPMRSTPEGARDFASTRLSANAGLARVATFGPAVGSPPKMPQESPSGTRSTDALACRTRPSRCSPWVRPRDAVVVDPGALALVHGGAEDVPDALRAAPGARGGHRWLRRARRAR